MDRIENHALRAKWAQEALTEHANSVARQEFNSKQIQQETQLHLAHLEKMKSQAVEDIQNLKEFKEQQARKATVEIPRNSQPKTEPSEITKFQDSLALMTHQARLSLKEFQQTLEKLSQEAADKIPVEDDTEYLDTDLKLPPTELPNDE